MRCLESAASQQAAGCAGCGTQRTQAIFQRSRLGTGARSKNSGLRVRAPWRNVGRLTLLVSSSRQTRAATLGRITATTTKSWWEVKIMLKQRMAVAIRRVVLGVLAGFGLMIAIAGEAAAGREMQHTEPFNGT